MNAFPFIRKFNRVCKKIIDHLLQPHWVGLDEFRHAVVDLGDDVLALLARLHLVRVDHLVNQLSRINSIQLNLEMVLGNIGNILQVLDVELNHAVAILYCLEQRNNFWAMGQFLQEYVGVLVDGLEGVHELARDALVGKLDPDVKFPLLGQLNECSLLLNQQHLAGLVVENDWLLCKRKDPVAPTTKRHLKLLTSLHKLFVIDNVREADQGGLLILPISRVFLQYLLEDLCMQEALGVVFGELFDGKSTSGALSAKALYQVVGVLVFEDDFLLAYNQDICGDVLQDGLRLTFFSLTHLLLEK